MSLILREDKHIILVLGICYSDISELHDTLWCLGIIPAINLKSEAARVSDYKYLKLDQVQVYCKGEAMEHLPDWLKRIRKIRPFDTNLYFKGQPTETRTTIV